MGSISFGEAFVAGKKRVPSPAAGSTAFFNDTPLVDVFKTTSLLTGYVNPD